MIRGCFEKYRKCPEILRKLSTGIRDVHCPIKKCGCMEDVWIGWNTVYR